ncbi:phage portal protein [Campylobacter sp. RM16190]|uniref:phage portal protein n=1 Tax=Campylobacter sp. RM16190 TaxID=1705727 RepID=UPI00201E1C69|nr:phage portal protein [Campylobacter sp. RM16190]
MKFFKNFFTPPKTRGEADDIFTATTNGVSVSNENALKISAVYACVRAISETISTLPFEIYQTDGKQRVIAQNHPIRPLIKVAPNPKMNIAQFLEALLTSMLLRGNGYIRPIRARNGQVLQLDILDASQVSLQERSNDVYFQYTGKDGTYNFGLDEIVNIPYFTLDGITGLSPIAKCRNGLELTQIAENHGKSFFSNGAFPSGVIEVPTELNQEAYDRMKNSWQKAYSGENAYKTAVLEGGAAYKGISIPNKDAQFLELRAFQTTDIARMFRVPPHMIADLTKATFSNIEQQSKEFAEFTILPLVVKIEKALNHRLLKPNEWGNFYFKFNINAITRGDMKSRFEAYNLGRNMGVYSANDIRELEDLNPIKNGDIYLQPLNMSEAGKGDNGQNDA